MTPERWQQVKGVLQGALELAPDERRGFLDRTCSTDHSLRREVELLIIENEQIGTRFLSTAAIPDEVRFQLSPGKRIGAYEILEEIAHGGMGVVYGAVRADGQYKQRVALKIVRTDLDAELTATRFRNERQILASLDHPNIAKILDGGTTADGIPYFVMEFIDGLPITEYCDKRELSIDSRLQIFRTVCSAVHYAHQRLVIHRDLKPSNILITTEGIPKLLDFGIAKILDLSLAAENTTVTAGNLWLMTPEYASPEQVRNETITTATDVYSLGIILYLLLTGRHPYKTKRAALHELVRAICEEEPGKPSAAVSRSRAPVTADDSTSAIMPIVTSFESKKLRRALAGDLDNIVLKALRKEPGRRYASVEQFSEDIRRHLARLPVIAHHDSLRYRAQKFVSRNRLGVVAVALVILSLLAGFITTLQQARSARAERARAERRFNDVRSLANSLIFGVHDSIQNLPGATSARSLVVRQGLQYLDLLSNESAGDPGLQKELAAGYQKLGDVQGNNVLGNLGDRGGAITSYRKALSFREGLVRQFPHDITLQNDLAESYERLARTLEAVGEQTQADSYLEKALGIAKPLAEQNPKNPSALYTLGVTEWEQGSSLWRKANLEGALKAYRESSETFTRGTILQPNDARTKRGLAIDHKCIGGVLELMGRLDEAAINYRRALDIDQEFLAQEANSTMRLRDVSVDFRNLGDILTKQGKLQLARKEYTRAIAVDKRLVEADPADRDTQSYLAADHECIGQVLLKMGEAPAALSAFRVALNIHEGRIKADPSDADAKDFFARSYLLFGDAYASLARSAPRPDRSRYFQNSCAAYNKASDIWNSMQAKGILNKTFESERSNLVTKLRNCNH